MFLDYEPCQCEDCRRILSFDAKGLLILLGVVVLIGAVSLVRMLLGW